ncbi:MAG: hypothetical protein ACI89L_001479 [Phycisphaerales bacterium]
MPPAQPFSTGPDEPAPLTAGGWVWYGPLAPFDPRRVPPMARQNYKRELTAALFLPFVLVLFEGSVLSVLVRLGFEGKVNDGLLNTMTAFIAVAPALANLSSFVWVRLAHGRHKVESLTRIMAVMLVVVLLIGVAPRNELGLILTGAAALGARLCWSGILTLRSTIWRQNYPDGSRAQITGRFAMVLTLLLTGLTLLLGYLMNLSELTLRVAVPVGCVLGVVGLQNWRQVRVREHKALIDSEQSTHAYHAPSFNPAKLLQVLRDDKDFDRYMSAQMLLGVGNIMSMALLPIVLRERFETDYLQSLLVTSILSIGVMPFAIPFWSRRLDAKHAVSYRAIHSWVFVASLSLLIAGIGLGSYPVLLVFALVRGFGFAGGALGWTLAHLDFAPPEQTTRYMGVHVTLTGLRGLICWLSGVAIYEGLERVEPGAGVWVFVLSLGLTLGGAVAFVVLSRSMKRRGVINQDGSRV